MRSVKLAVKATLEHFAAFVTASSGTKKDAKGKDVPNNARGNLSFIVDGVEFDSDNEAAQYAEDNGFTIRSVVAASVNEAKGSAARSAVQEIEIPPTEEVSADSLELWKTEAQEAAITAADKTTRPEVSTRGQKAALDAQVSSLTETASTRQLSESEKDEVIAALLGLRAMEK